MSKKYLKGKAEGRLDKMKKHVGMHSGYFRGTHLENDVFEIIRIIHESGGNAVEFMPGQLLPLSPEERTKFRSLLEEYNMDLIVGAGRSAAVDPSSPDPAIQDAAYRFAKEVMEMLHQVGCHKWDGLVHACWPGHPTPTLTAEAKMTTLKRSAENMKKLLPLAEDYEINLCFEVVNRFEHYLLNTAEEAVNFCKMVDHPRAKILLDVFHMNIEEENMNDAILATGKSGLLGHFHVGEPNRNVPGTCPTHLDWSRIFQSLETSGYEGTVILEPFVISGVPYSHNVSLWRDLTRGGSFQQYLENIKVGINFIKQFWT